MKGLDKFFHMMVQRFDRAHLPFEHALEQIVLELYGLLTRTVVKGDVV